MELKSKISLEHMHVDADPSATLSKFQTKSHLRKRSLALDLTGFGVKIIKSFTERGKI